MQVRFKQSVMLNGSHHVEGDVVDLPDDVAKMLVAREHAEPHDHGHGPGHEAKREAVLDPKTRKAVHEP